MHASIESLDTSLTATFAPYLDRARAMPLPMFGPQPVTSATLPSSETSNVIPPPVISRGTTPRAPAVRPWRPDSKPRSYRAATDRQGRRDCLRVDDYVGARPAPQSVRGTE